MVYKWLRNAQSVLYPPTCLLCDEPGFGSHDLCLACARELPRLEAACLRCARPLPSAGLVCGTCQRDRPDYDAAWAAFRYEGPIAELVTGLKFGRRLVNARLLGALMLERRLAADPTLPDAFVPTPLHPSRLRERGFNQALELARPLARAFGVALAWRVCERRRATLAQSSLPPAARRANLRGAFRVLENVSGLNLVIVDDVLTSGSTACELAGTLKRAGARRVEVWVCARAAARR